MIFSGRGACRQAAVLLIAIAGAGLPAAAEPEAVGPEQRPEPRQERPDRGGQADGTSAKGPAFSSDFRWHVGLVDARASGGAERNGLYCSGSLVAPSWILTSGDCASRRGVVEADVDLAPADIDVWVGSPSFNFGQRMKVAAIRLHPDYDQRTGANNIALLKLATPAPASGTAIVTLAGSPEEAGMIEERDDVTVTGWFLPDGTVADRLQKDTLVIAARKACNERHTVALRAALASRIHGTVGRLGLPPSVAERAIATIASAGGSAIHSTMICSRDRFGDSAGNISGDPGSALLAGHFNPNKQLGIVAFRSPMADPPPASLWGVAVRVAPYKPWIEATTAN